MDTITVDSIKNKNKTLYITLYNPKTSNTIPIYYSLSELVQVIKNYNKRIKCVVFVGRKTFFNKEMIEQVKQVIVDKDIYLKNI